MRESSVGCVLIGPGQFGRSLAKALVEDERARLVGVLGATTEESAAGVAALGARAFESLDAVVSAPDVDAVFIATPSSTHARLAVASAQAGKHVFCEKPMALTVAECDAMIEAARTAGVTLMVGQLQRLVPLLADVREIVQRGTLGRPVVTLMRRHDLLQRRPGSWLQRRDEVGGVLHQSSVHEIDWLRSMLGEVEEAYARAGAATIQAGLNFPDAVEMSFRFRNGCVVTLSACMTSYVQRHDGAVLGTEGSLNFSLTDGTLEWRRQDGEGERTQREDYIIGPGHRLALREELRAFLDAVIGGGAPLLPGEEGRANVEVIQAALISLAEGRPVGLPLGEGEWDRRAYLEL